jgi:hypothetical protein
MKSVGDIRVEWLKHLLSTAPADRRRAEAGVRRLYAAAGFAEPRAFLWFDSPRAASWVVELIAERYHGIMAQTMSSSRDARTRLDRARATLGERLGIGDPNQAVAAVGVPRCTHLMFPPNPTHLLATHFVAARFGLSNDPGSWFTPYSDADDLCRAESRFIGGNHGVLVSSLYSPYTERMIGASFYADYPISHMADDQRLAGDREPPPIMHGAWEVAQSAGLWWPFEHAAILCDRPAELHVNAQYVPHCEDGPAIVFRDGSSAFAWNGKNVPEKWIAETEAVPPREYRGFDPTFVKWAKSKAAPAEKTKKRSKPGSILKTVLPTDPAARLEQLRTYAGGSLPMHDRYQAGAHRDVWRELVALGLAVREDPHAADALAVAYETMRRVDANVRTLVERLTALGFRFGMPGDSGFMAVARGLFGGAKAKPRAHIPPAPDVQKQLASFEKEYGPLPLSLRAFYEVVGEVNLVGTHPSIDPPNGRVATDALLVYAFDEGALELDEEDEGSGGAITIAPDDLHKANTSGGDPYEMAIPDPRADGELLNERHELLFVDYLRLCFRFGGFPGYDGQANLPPELSGLSAGLMEF